MSRDNKEDILLSSKCISICSDTRILIVGGGRAGYIKLCSFANRGFRVDVLSDVFSDEIEKLAHENPKVKLMRSSYRSEILETYELVFVGTNDDGLNETIAGDCKRMGKLFAYLPDARAGRVSIPVEVETEHIKLSVGTKSGSPKTAVFLGQKLKSVIVEYDDFVGYICSIRRKISNSERKREVMEFVNTDEFYEYYRAGKGDTVLKTFYGGDFFEDNTGD